MHVCINYTSSSQQQTSGKAIINYNNLSVISHFTQFSDMSSEKVFDTEKGIQLGKWLNWKVCEC